jgi:hypothetical protein
MKNVLKLPISIDWLQLYCDGSGWMADKDYNWIEQPYQTKHFKKQYVVVYKNEEIATVQSVPSSNIMPKEAMIIKFSNRELYGQDLSGLVSAFLTHNNIIFRSITRLDLAIDFEKFATGDKPEKFIKKFMSCDYLKNGRGKYCIFGEQKQSHTFDYLRFGTKQSELNVYMYNKTKELEQVKDKPYIRKLWSEFDLGVGLPVWRLEFSMKGKACSFVDMNSGETFRLDLSIIGNKELLNRVFFSLLNQYFEFKKNNGTKNKTRMETLILFVNCEVDLKPLYLPKEPCSSKSDKVFIKKLYQLDQELREIPDEYSDIAHKLMTEFAIRSGLVDFTEKKIETWNRTHFRP